MSASTFAPPRDLADVVASLWVGHWDLEGQPPHVTELLGDPCFNVAFERSDQKPRDARLVGVWTKLWQRELSGRGRVRAAKLKAGAVRCFFQLAASEYANRSVPLTSVGWTVPEELVAGVLDADDDELGLAPLIAQLRAVRRPSEDGELAVELVERIVSDPHVTSVERLADATGYGARVLQRIFREHVGAPPKWVIRRNRLQEAALRIERGDEPSLAALAAELGYADQAHLARDFKAATGKPPSAFARSVNEG